jgi:hypothetical protein
VPEPRQLEGGYEALDQVSYNLEGTRVPYQLAPHRLLGRLHGEYFPVRCPFWFAEEREKEHGDAKGVKPREKRRRRTEPLTLDKLTLQL